MKRRLVFTRAVAGLSIAGLLAFSGCDQEQGFECGRVAPGTSEIRACDGANEVCVCSTNSCAKKVGILPNERAAFAGAGAVLDVAGASAEADAWGDCLGPGLSGYRYVDAPFARDGLAGNCVKLSDIRLGDLVPSDKTPGPGCPGQVELPDASIGGTGGGSGSAGANNAGESSAGTSGAGESGAGAGAMSGEAGTAGAAGAGMSGDGGMSGGGAAGASGSAGEAGLMSETGGAQ